MQNINFFLFCTNIPKEDTCKIGNKKENKARLCLKQVKIFGNRVGKINYFSFSEVYFIT